MTKEDMVKLRDTAEQTRVQFFEAAKPSARSE